MSDPRKLAEEMRKAGLESRSSYEADLFVEGARELRIALDALDEKYPANRNAALMREKEELEAALEVARKEVDLQTGRKSEWFNEATLLGRRCAELQAELDAAREERDAAVQKWNGWQTRAEELQGEVAAWKELAETNAAEVRAWRARKPLGVEAAVRAIAEDVVWALGVLRCADDFEDEGSPAHRASTYLERVIERMGGEGVREAAEGFAAGMREERPDICWRNLVGDHVCIQDRGHDGGVHEPAEWPLAGGGCAPGCRADSDAGLHKPECVLPATSQGPASSPLLTREEAEQRAKAELRQAVWEADQFMEPWEIRTYVESVSREIESDRP